MPEATAPNPQSDAEQLEAAADQARGGGYAREAVKALIVANNNFLEAEIEASVSRDIARRSARKIPNLLRLS
jgi:hypothetical protein